MYDWIHGTKADEWTSMAVPSDGSYGVAPGVVFSFPVTCKDGKYSIVQGGGSFIVRFIFPLTELIGIFCLFHKYSPLPLHVTAQA